jgi:hypothetical protein
LILASRFKIEFGKWQFIDFMATRTLITCSRWNVDSFLHIIEVQLLKVTMMVKWAGILKMNTLVNILSQAFGTFDENNEFNRIRRS